MYDRLQEAPLYKEMTRLATEKARAEALKEAEEARKRDSRKVLLSIIKKRFPKLSRSAKQLVSTVDHANVLEKLIIEISTASTPKEALQYLREISKEDIED